MKKHTLKVILDITFTEDANVTTKDEVSILENLKRAIKDEILSGGGIAPEVPDIEGGDYITETIAFTSENAKDFLDLKR